MENLSNFDCDTQSQMLYVSYIIGCWMETLFSICLLRSCKFFSSQLLSDPLESRPQLHRRWAGPSLLINGKRNLQFAAVSKTRCGVKNSEFFDILIDLATEAGSAL